MKVFDGAINKVMSTLKCVERYGFFQKDIDKTNTCNIKTGRLVTVCKTIITMFASRLPKYPLLSISASMRPAYKSLSSFTYSNNPFYRSAALFYFHRHPQNPCFINDLIGVRIRYSLLISLPLLVILNLIDPPVLQYIVPKSPLPHLQIGSSVQLQFIIHFIASLLTYLLR